MTPNTFEVQVLRDDFKTAIVKVTGFYTSSNTSNTVFLKANNLVYGNTSLSSNNYQLSITKIQYAVDSAAGVAGIYWEGSNSNGTILALGTSCCGVIDAPIGNNANGATGCLGITLDGFGGTGSHDDALNFIITLNKDTGYESAYDAYRAGGVI